MHNERTPSLHLLQRAGCHKRWPNPRTPHCARGAPSSSAWSVSGILQPALRPSSRLALFSFPNLAQHCPSTLQEAWINSSPAPSSSWRRYRSQSVMPMSYPITDSLLFYSSVKVPMQPYVPRTSDDSPAHPGAAVAVVHSPRSVANEKLHRSLKGAIARPVKWLR